MERNDRQRRSRRKPPLQLTRMMKYEVKQACAVMLCVSMILGNIASTVVAADQNTDKPYEFELKGTELYGALQDAIANDRIADQDWKFQGLAEADYQSLFEKEGDLYQLKPELDQDSAVKLQIYARLTNDIPVDDMYVVDGSEEFYFFLTNESKLERKVVISVDEKHTEVINVAPKSAVEMSDADAYLTAGDLKPGEAGGTVTAGGGSGNGGSGGGSGSGGSSSGGSGSGESADGTVTDESQNPDSDKVPGEGDAGTDETGGDTGENGGDAGTDETGGNTGENSGDAGTDETGGNTGENGGDAGTDETGGNTGENGGDTGTDETGGNTGENGGDAGTDETGGNTGENGGDAGTGENAGENGGDAGAGENSGSTGDTGSAGGNGDTGNTDNSGSTDNGNDNSGSSADISIDTNTNSGDSSSNDSQTGGSDVSILDSNVASISRHVTHRVGTTATPSDADEDEKADVPTESEDADDLTSSSEATPSDATPSDADEDLMEGTLYRPILMDGEAAVLFVTTAADLELEDVAFEVASDSNALQKFSADLGHVRVDATALPGTFPEGTELVVTELAEDGIEYQDAKAKLDEAGTTYDGMKALDISFLDEEGNEIEPDSEAGEVRVSIQMMPEALPEDADPSTLEVQHLAESSGSVVVEPVAGPDDSTEGTVEVIGDEAEAAVAAEFAVDGFSVFTITWEKSNWPYTSYFEITVHYVDQYGEEISTETGEKITVNENTSDIKINEYKKEIKGYEFNKAEYKNTQPRQDVVFDIRENTYLRTKKDGEVRKIEIGEVSNEGNWIVKDTLTEQEWLGFTQTQRADIYFRYQKPEIVSAKVYLRYDNAVPKPINQSYGTGLYGPSSDNNPYITVNVDLGKIKANSEDIGGNRYYSIQSDAKDGYAYDATNDATNKENATKYWKEVIYPAIDENGKKAINDTFGTDQFIGYVLKKEITDNAWHIDGVLKNDPPLYLVELYQDNYKGECLFTINSNSEELPGVAYDDFKKKLEIELGGSNHSYSESWNKVEVTYEKDGKWYRSVITPVSNDNIDKPGQYQIDIRENKFGYKTISDNVFYLCRLQMVTTVVSGNLILEKQVKGSAADLSEHFKFTLYSETLKGKSYQATYVGNDSNCGTEHKAEIVFDAGGNATVELKHGESVSILALPINSNIKISETPGTYTTATTTTVNGVADSKQPTVTISEDTIKVIFENTQTIVAPTGVLTNKLPYLLMVTAALCTAAMLFNGFGRRARRRRDDE